VSLVRRARDGRPDYFIAVTEDISRRKHIQQDRDALLLRGDAFMATVRDLTPADGALSEQVDRASGAQTSARHLTWSYAAFVSTARLRAQACRG
jgi:GH15 family glucan-1,4-alpha-glucosidase